LDISELSSSGRKRRRKKKILKRQKIEKIVVRVLCIARTLLLPLAWKQNKTRKRRQENGSRSRKRICLKSTGDGRSKQKLTKRFAVATTTATTAAAAAATAAAIRVTMATVDLKGREWNSRRFVFKARPEVRATRVSSQLFPVFSPTHSSEQRQSVKSF
jgi:hypothetical protein